MTSADLDRDVFLEPSVYAALVEAMKPEERMFEGGLVLYSETPEGGRRLTFKPQRPTAENVKEEN